ncbi:MAG: lipopolysaccharide transport system permease protein [Acidobacteriota bacterium]|nr:lipopolysaccharide transport system permease protein [Acidobacteriota bacterium]
MDVNTNERASAPEATTTADAQQGLRREVERVRSGSVTDAPTLPREPRVRVRPGGAGLTPDLKEVWAYRELLYFFVWRDVKVRYKQTALGAAWALIQPLATMLVFTLFFGKVAGASAPNVPYPLFAYAGLVLWTFFANAVSNSGNSLVSSANLLTKVYFPRAIIPASAVAAGLFDFVIASALLVPLLLWYGVAPGRTIVFAPLFVLLATLCALGVGMWTSALNVKYRDVRYVLPFAVQVWMFASSVIVPSSFAGARWRWLLMLNPLTGIIEGFRASVFGQTLDWPSVAISALITLALLFAGLAYFHRMEENFADVV